MQRLIPNFDNYTKLYKIIQKLYKNYTKLYKIFIKLINIVVFYLIFEFQSNID